jgi:transcriptional regulator with XRE-family HTH domain
MSARGRKPRAGPEPAERKTRSPAAARGLEEATQPSRVTTTRLDVSAILARLQQERRSEPTDGETADAIGIHRGRFSQLKAKRAGGAEPAAPTLAELEKLCVYFDVPVTTFLEGHERLLRSERSGIAWLLRAGFPGLREAEIRDVAVQVLRGHDRLAIARDLATERAARAARLPSPRIKTAVRKRGPKPKRSRSRAEGAEARSGVAGALAPSEVAVEQARLAAPSMVRAAFTLGLVALAPAIEPEKLERIDLARRLTDAFAAATDGAQVEVHVVRNVAHGSFHHDPIAPFVIARVAHRVLGRFLAEHPHAYTIGIAGGFHVGALVRSITLDSSPFPDQPQSDRGFTLVPLTLEPFHDHRLEHADALVGEFFSRANAILGSGRISAPSFVPFGYLEDRAVAGLETDSVVTVRDHYNRLAVAIFGCGDRGDEGWLANASLRLGVLSENAETDVCLNMLSEEAKPLPLPGGNGRREYLGVGLDVIRSLARQGDRLALLLGSGANKGKPISLVVRAGCANVVICDEAAGRAALAALGKSEPDVA